MLFDRGGFKVRYSFNNSFKQIEEAHETIERVFKPYIAIMKAADKHAETAIDSFEQVNKQAENITGFAEQVEQFKVTADILNKNLEPLKKTNRKLANQISNIMKPLKNFELISNNLILPSFIESYNSTKKLINDFNKYDEIKSDEQLQAILEMQENYSDSDNIESKLKDLGEEDQSKFSAIMKRFLIGTSYRINNNSSYTEAEMLSIQYEMTEVLSEQIPQLAWYFFIINMILLMIKK